MDNFVTEIGTFEAKTRLAELLRETEAGASYLIMRRGVPVGRLVPPEKESLDETTELFEGFASIREKVLKKSGNFENLKELIEEGRK